MVTMFNHDVLPAVPSQGSVGVSGDLTPLAHVAAAMMGEGRIIATGQLMPASVALAAHGMAPLKLRSTAGLAPLHGTQASTALALSAAIHARQALDPVVRNGVLTNEAGLGSGPTLQ